jgi:Ca2+-binding RTX toxin-like protein
VLDFGTGAAALDGLNTTVAYGAITSHAAVRIGLSGNDQLDGGTGADTMAGGVGNDLYLVDNSADVVTEAANAGHDIVRSTASYTLGDNLEDLALTGTLAVNATGNAGANTLRGNSAANRLDGGAGGDMLVGGAGDDSYFLARGSGADIAYEYDFTAGNTDLALFEAGINIDQLWFRRVSNSLEVSVIGTADRLTVSGWYSGDQYHLEQFKTSDGRTLLDSQVNNLVNAMAAFAPPAMGQTSLSVAVADQLSPVLAANWH